MPTTNFRPTSPTNQNRPKVKISNFCVFCPIWMKFGMGANNGAKTTQNEFDMPTTIFQPTSPTNQNRPKVKFSNLRVFCPIWIKFGIWAENGTRITWYKFKMATATFYASTETPHIPSRTIILFRFFCLKIKYFMPNSVHESNTSHLLIPSIQFLPFPSRAKQ